MHVCMCIYIYNPPQPYHQRAFVRHNSSPTRWGSLCIRKKPPGNLGEIMFLNRSGKAFTSILAGKCQAASSSMVICFMKRCRFENLLLSVVNVYIRELYFVQVFPAWWNSALHCSICCVFYLHQNLSILYVDLENMYTIPVRTIWVFHRGHSQETCHCRGGRSTGPLRGYHVPWSILGTCFLYKSIVYICTHIFGYIFIYLYLCIFMYFDISILISRDICKSKSICISFWILSIHSSIHLSILHVHLEVVFWKQ